MTIDLPLISPLSRKYFKYASEKDGRIHHRAEDIRICLEYVCDEIIIELVSPEHKVKWGGYRLHDKIKSTNSFMDDSIVNRLIRAKIIGNEGVHKGEEGIYSSADIEEAMESIKQFSLAIFTSYFEKNGFGDSDNCSWLPTVFSTLPPIYRVEILKQYYTLNPSAFVIDKLSKAYLKSGSIEEAMTFIEDCLKNEEISYAEYSILKNDLSLLEKNFELLPIADNLDKAKLNFNQLSSVIAEEEKDAFICLVSMILNGKA